MLRDNKYITKVNLSATKLGHEGCESLAEALRTNEAITELNISENPGTLTIVTYLVLCMTQKLF